MFDRIEMILNRMNNKRKLKEAQLKEVESNFDLIEANRRIKKLKREIKADKKESRKGFFIFCFAVLGTIATTLISIAGGINDYTDFRYTFVTAMITVQLGLFLLTTSETTIKNKYPNHFAILKILQIGLLLLSIRFNYIFFARYSNNDKFSAWILLLCIIFDLVILKSIVISADLRLLNHHKRNDFDFENMGILKMLFFNWTAKFRINTLRAFNYNKAQYKKALKENEIYINENTSVKTEMTKSTGNPKNIEADEKKLLEGEKQENFALSNDREDLLKVIFENKSSENVCPSLSKLEELTGLSRPKITKLKKDLVNEGILTSENRKTIVNVNSFDNLN
jgi:hypothetical protein